MGARVEASRLARAAAGYAAHGWLVLPLHSPAGGGCSCRAGRGCGSAGKHPRTAHGLRDASTDADVIARWWRRWPHANVGVVTGASSSTMVLDVDLPDGPGALAALERDHGRLPATLQQRTGSGGRQLFFRLPPGGVGNRAGLCAGLDVRGDGGYVVVPPSVHRSGRRYRWIHRQPPAAAPGWLVDLVRPARVASAIPETVFGMPAGLDRTHPYAVAAMADELRTLAAATEGDRNGALNRSAFRLGQLAGAGLLDPDVAQQQLTRAARHVAAKPARTAFTDREIAQTIASGLDAGMRRPRRVSHSQPGRRGARAEGAGGRR